MGQVEIGSQVLHESMLPKCVTDGTNSIMHVTLDVMRLIDADVLVMKIRIAMYRGKEEVLLRPALDGDGRQRNVQAQAGSRVAP